MKTALALTLLLFTSSALAAVVGRPDDLTGEATLKRFYREAPGTAGSRARIRLEPRNPTMSPIYVDPDHLRIQGKVVGVLRLMA